MVTCHARSQAVGNDGDDDGDCDSDDFDGDDADADAVLLMMTIDSSYDDEVCLESK